MKPAVQGVSVNGVTLFTPLSIVTGGNDVIAIDNDTGATFWYKSFGAVPSTSACAAAGSLPGHLRLPWRGKLSVVVYASLVCRRTTAARSTSAAWKSATR